MRADLERLGEILEILPVYLTLLTPDYRVSFANRFFRERFGETHGRRCYEYLFGRTAPCDPCESFKPLQTQAPHRWEWTSPDGRHYETHDFFLADIDGSALILEVGIDITERKKTERRLQEARDLLEMLVTERTAALRESNARLQAEIGERQKAAEALQRYSGLLQLLHEADQAILSARSEEEISKAAIRYVPQLLDCVQAGVVLFDRKAGKALWLATHAEGEARLGKGRRSPISGEWAALLETLARGEIYVVENVQEKPPLLVGEHTSVYVPLMIEGELAGALALGKAIPGPLNAEQETIAREVATQIAVGIQQARLHERVQRHADDLKNQLRQRTRALRASEARFRTIFEKAAIGIALLDGKGQIEECNPALQSILGSTAEELRGKSLQDFSHPDHIPVDNLYEELLTKDSPRRYRRERRFIRKDGQLGWANVTVSRVRRHGEKHRFVVIIEDITERKRAQEALVQSEKLTLTGRLAAALAHEINNPLQSVIGCLELVEESLAEGKDTRQFLQLAARELERVAVIVSQLRDLNRPSKPAERKPTDVGILIERVLDLTRNQRQKQRVKVEWQSTDNLPLLMVVPDQIQQVFLNLTLNALEAMPDGGRLEVRANRTAEPPGVRVSFTDSGKGITASMMPHLFEPFYTTKPDGIGLGLYVTHNIVDVHGGHIEVKSREGEGTTFTVWLPA